MALIEEHFYCNFIKCSEVKLLPQNNQLGQHKMFEEKKKGSDQ